MLIIRDSFPYRVIKIPNEFVNIELVCVDLSNHSTYKIIVYNRSGGSYLEAENYATEIIKCLHHFCSIKRTICLLGDFNLSAFNWTQHQTTASLDFFLEFFTVHTTYCLLGLKSSLSAEPNGIPNLFLKKSASLLATPLSHLFDASFKDQKLPQEWKIVLVTPIHKKVPPHLLKTTDQYQLHHLAAELMKEQSIILMQYLLPQYHNLIDCSQHGFILARSTTTNILECTQQWTDAMQKKQNFNIIYLDFCKAFDSVSHVKLMNKICTYCLNDNTRGWLKDFLNLRSQRVNINGFISDEVAVTSGAPQDSVLCPTLFLPRKIYHVNDLPNTLTNSDTICKLFVDDVKLYNKSPSRLQYSLDRIVEWSEKW